MLQTTTTVFADIRMEEKGLEFRCRSHKFSRFSSSKGLYNVAASSAVRGEWTIIYFQSILHVYVTCILSCLAVNRNEGPILGLTCTMSYILHL